MLDLYLLNSVQDAPDNINWIGSVGEWLQNNWEGMNDSFRSITAYWEYANGAADFIDSLIDSGFVPFFLESMIYFVVAIATIKLILSLGSFKG